MNKTLIVVIILAVVIIGGYLLFRGGSETAQDTLTQPQSGVPAPGQEGVQEETTNKDETEEPLPSQETGETPADQEETEPAEGEPEVIAPSKVKEVTVISTEFAFSPLSITVQAGDEVRLKLKNEGGARHDLEIEGLGVRTERIDGGQTDTIEFTAPASGTYTFICSIPGHKEAGMVGSLKVE